MPVDADQQPVPAILEFLPYRKNDGTIYRDEITLPATAEKAYACIRVDIRGTGESEGLFDDEYSEQELSDAEQVIDWISQQPWCDGNVGMVGISWGGFNALQLAYRQPAALKAIITICSTDDRFNEDIHFAGGCLLNDNLDWASFFWSYALARCPDPRLVGDDWKRQWLHRHGWLGRCLSEYRIPPAGEPFFPLQGTGWPMGAQIPEHCLSRPKNRLCQGICSLVG